MSDLIHYKIQMASASNSEISEILTIMDHLNDKVNSVQERVRQLESEGSAMSGGAKMFEKLADECPHRVTDQCNHKDRPLSYNGLTCGFNCCPLALSELDPAN